MAKLFGDVALRQMREMWRRSRQRQPANVAPQLPRGIVQQNVEGVLIESLAAASDCLTGPSTAWVQRLVRRDSGDLELSGGNSTQNDDDYYLLTNRSKDLHLSRLTYVICKVVNGEFRWDSGDCSAGSFDVGPGPSGTGGGSIAGGGGAGSGSPFGNGNFGGGGFGS